ncbi:glutaredoxin [Gloeophyllum trabeum ATCC 11539]|uniref:Monothiol glutaredoxin-5, mitochondrial n=1 Tax=Gloeophyllum trabeum (strain ATCC 11539 / FP-39264 / Madison 617) TaxID=670483 RepID=S7Q9E8_GLOTA|nr:glutaredoxin [Gloeophyllum trabeum ATCC 11539]EPQ56546.1 glutaredoxin [Gloeophyllum trabeum ATCC 11539]
MFRSALRASTSLSFAVRRTAAAPRATALSPGLQFARRYLSNDVRQKIQQAVQSTPVVVFMKGTPDLPQCGFSRAVVQVLDLHGVPPEKMKTFNVLEDSELRSSIKEFSDWPTVPQVYINGEFVGGCDIILSMHQSGELENLLEKADVIPKIPESESQTQSSASSS